MGAGFVEVSCENVNEVEYHETGGGTTPTGGQVTQ